MNSIDQKASLKEALEVFDKEKTGAISAAELRHVLSNLGDVDEDEVDDMMKEADNGKGVVNIKDFLNIVFNAVSLPPAVVIDPELKPYYDALLSKEAGKNKE